MSDQSLRDALNELIENMQEDPWVHAANRLVELMAANPADPRPLLDDRGVYRIVGDHGITDAIMELARPMPTREQIAEALSVCTCAEGRNQHGYWRKIDMGCPACGTTEAKADAVLALLNANREGS